MEHDALHRYVDIVLAQWNLDGARQRAGELSCASFIASTASIDYGELCSGTATLQDTRWLLGSSGVCLGALN